MSEKNEHLDRPERKQNENGTQPFSQQNGNQKISVRGLNCWFDSEDSKALFLLGVPDKESLKQLQRVLNGNISPSHYLEISSEEFGEVLSTLEQICKKKEQDKEKQQNKVLAVMVGDVKHDAMEKEQMHRFYDQLKTFKACIRNKMAESGGDLLNESVVLTVFSFPSACDALEAALQLRSNFYSRLDPEIRPKVKLKIGLSGIPEVNGALYSREVVRTARRMAYIAKKEIVICPTAEDLFQREKLDPATSKDKLVIVGKDDYRFLTRLFNFMERKWQDDALHVNDLAQYLNCSKSQVYRKMVELSGLSPNSFIKEYRLDRALDLIQSTRNSIAEIAFEAGFSSPSYFTKCFQKRYGLAPSEYMQVAGFQNH